MAEQAFGRYTIKKELGRGGMGTVFLAYDSQRDHDVGLKVLPRALLHDPNFRDRFANEAKIIIRLEHHAIVPVYDVGEHDGQPYLSMRLMRGGSLADRLQSGPVSTADAEKIMRRICAALDKSHRNNIIHRDLKPGNILFDEDGSAYLADFGIARLAEGTQTMTVIGTPQYMAPEQATGHALDGRTDVYQMGAVLFEMLTGDLPFAAPTPAALLYQHAHAPIPSIRERNADLPPTIEHVIGRAMAKDKTQRFQTPGELAQVFSDAIRGKEVQPLPLAALEKRGRAPQTSAPATRSTKKKPWVFLLGLLALLLLAGGANFILSRPEKTPVEEGGVAIAVETPVESAATDSTDAVPATDTPAAAAPTDTPLPVAAPATDTPQPATTVPEPTDVPSPTPSPTPDRSMQSYRIGTSVEGQPIEVFKVGLGAKKLVIVGGLHAGYTPASIDLSERFVAYYSDLSHVPLEATIYILPNVSPDSPYRPGEKPGRVNANDVDLNRNFDCDWSAEALWRDEPISGGTAPFSEPETQALRDFFLDVQPDMVIFYEAKARDGMVAPGVCGSKGAEALAWSHIYSNNTGQPVFEGFAVTGDGSNWLVKIDIPAFAILLKQYEGLSSSDFNNNLAGVTAVLRELIR